MSNFAFRDRKPSRTQEQCGITHLPRWRHIRLTATASMLAVSLTGCLGYNHNEERYDVATDVEERYPIQVTQGMARLDIDAAGRNGRLSGDDEVRVAEFVREYRAQGSGPFVVARPVGGGRDVAAAGKVARLQGVLHRAGLPGNAVNYRVYKPRPGEKRANVILTYSRYQATSPECGYWSRNIANTYDNKQSGNFGCATQRNLAAMVANPRDLVVPRTMDPADAARRDVVIDAYRKGDTTGSERSGDESGKVSEQEQGE